jgi:hypothetical protein
MAQSKQCLAIKQSGDQCRNRISVERKNTDYCYRHRRKRTGAISKRQPGEIGSRFEKIERGVRFTASTGSTLYLVYKILDFLIKHWDDINRFFHGLDTNYHLYMWRDNRKRCEVIMNANYIPHKDVAKIIREFDDWYQSAPNPVKQIITNRFGPSAVNQISAAARQA